MVLDIYSSVCPCCGGRLPARIYRKSGKRYTCPKCESCLCFNDKKTKLFVFVVFLFECFVFSLIYKLINDEILIKILLFLFFNIFVWSLYRFQKFSIVDSVNCLSNDFFSKKNNFIGLVLANIALLIFLIF